jgi:hypothetical protein
MKAAWVAAAVLVTSAACRKPPQPLAADAGPQVGAPAPTAAVGRASSDPAWVAARTGDPLELARLADLEGADALADVAQDDQASPEDRATAVRALSFVDDPTPAVEALSKLVSDASMERSTLALQTLVAVAPRRRPIEEHDPSAWRTCGQALLAALGPLKDAARRELALRVLHALADRGAVAASAIPAR